MVVTMEPAAAAVGNVRGKGLLFAGGTLDDKLLLHVGVFFSKAELLRLLKLRLMSLTGVFTAVVILLNADLVLVNIQVVVRTVPWSFSNFLLKCLRSR